MKKIFSCAGLLWLLMSHFVFANELEKESVKCPEITPAEMKALNGHVLASGAHKWYLHDMFELPDTLGSHVPTDISIQDVMGAKTISFFGQLDPRTCQYKIMLEKNHKATVTFKLMGD